jgi:serine/threonine-protein kinase
VKELLFWGKLAALAVALGALAFFGVMRLSVKGGTVTMPDLRGLPQMGAGMKLQELGLSMQVREERHSNTAPFGSVMEQSLEPGARLKRGRTIAVVVSIGNKVLSVPQLVGSASSRQARLLLEQNGLALGHLVRVFNEAPRDSVLAQSPEAGSEAARGESVSLLVSSGPRESARVVPDLRGRPLDEARSLAQRAELVLRRVVEASAVPANAAPGSVLSQSLSPSSRALAGAELALTVAPGGAAAVKARLAGLDLIMPAESLVERRLKVTIKDQLGERVVHNAMEKPGVKLHKEFKVYGPAIAEISINNSVVETRELP